MHQINFFWTKLLDNAQLPTGFSFVCLILVFKEKNHIDFCFCSGNLFYLFLFMWNVGTNQFLVIISIIFTFIQKWTRSIFFAPNYLIMPNCLLTFQTSLSFSLILFLKDKKKLSWFVLQSFFMSSVLDSLIYFLLSYSS